MISRKEYVMITGGSGGIGLELSKLFVSDGYNLILISKCNNELVNAVKVLKDINSHIKIYSLHIDLCSALAVKKIYDFTINNNVQIDILINCAGFGTYGFIDDIDIETEIQMLHLHIINFYYLTRLYLSDMIIRDHGHIINISSISAFQPSPYFATYGASKAFILQLTRALNFELKEHDSHVKLLVVCPTAVKNTGFQKQAKMNGIKAFDSWTTVTPYIVAKDTYDAIKSGKEFIIPGKKSFKIIKNIINFLPINWQMKLAFSQLQKNENGD